MSDNVEKVLQRVIEYCESVLRLEGKPSDDNVETCEKLLEIIRKELKE